MSKRYKWDRKEPEKRPKHEVTAEREKLKREFAHPRKDSMMTIKGPVTLKGRRFVPMKKAVPPTLPKPESNEEVVEVNGTKQAEEICMRLAAKDAEKAPDVGKPGEPIPDDEEKK